MIREKLSKFSEKTFSDRRILIFLIIANIAGFFAGLYFYWNQLMESHPLFWIIILDSPLSVLMIAVICALFYFGKKVPEAFKLLASVYLIKYGFWTLLALYLYWGNYTIPVDQTIGIIDFILHFGMIVEGAVLIPKIRPRFTDTLAVLAVLLLNDYCDYFLNMVTRIPDTYKGLLMINNFSATLLLTLSIFIFSFFRSRKP
jgi:uncharacterized membrane protein YpjA